MPLSVFPTAQQVNLPTCFSHCPVVAERQAGLREAVNTNFKAIDLTGFGIKPVSTAPEANVLTTRPWEVLCKIKRFQ